MNTKIQKSIVAGLLATVVMTAVMMIAPMMGLPKMSPPTMLSTVMGVPVVVGWVMHFIIGIIFAIAYTYLWVPKCKVCNPWLKGTLFGIVIFIFAQVMMKLMGMMLPMPAMEGSMLLNLMGGLIGHIIFGIVVAKTIGGACSNTTCTTKS